MKLTFSHKGQTRTLRKHPRICSALAKNVITEADARLEPWYLRYSYQGNITLKALSIADKDAIRDAKAELNGMTEEPALFIAYKKADAAKNSITVGDLCDEWLKLNLPKDQVKHRTQAQQDELRPRIERAMKWWRDIPYASLQDNAAVTCGNFAGWRAPHLTAADRELSAISACFNWAVLTGKIKTNFIHQRKKHAEIKVHCSEACPDDDETLHKMLGVLFTHLSTSHRPDGARNFTLSGGALAFCALSGLRPGEPDFLQRVPVLEEMPKTTKHLVPGTIFPDANKRWKMFVVRTKRGQNPFVEIHPALESFLSAWKAWLAKNLPDAKELFPKYTDNDNSLNQAVNLATETLGLPHMKPHGMRAYYVKVRRSQGTEDSTIAVELGQNSNGKLIRSTYGDPGDMVGGNLFDWLPEDGAPAWHLLNRTLDQRKKPLSGYKRKPKSMKKLEQEEMLEEILAPSAYSQAEN